MLLLLCALFGAVVGYATALLINIPPEIGAVGGAIACCSGYLLRGRW